MASGELTVMATANLQADANNLSGFLKTVMQLHQVLAGQQLSSPAAIKGSLRGEYATPENTAVTITPGYRKRFQRVNIMGGMALEVSGDEIDRFCTERNWFDRANLFRAKGIQSDNGELEGMQVEAIAMQEAAATGAPYANGVIIPGNELALATFRVVELVSP